MDQIDDVNEIPTSHGHPIEETGSATCSGRCNKVLSVGKSYYSLHSTWHKMPISFQHISEPGHDLNLLVIQSFVCKACGLEGSGFCYHCKICFANYHALCIRMPLSVSCASHQHELKIQFAPPYGHDMGFLCDICERPSYSLWLYRCSECDFDAHLYCAFRALIPQSQSQNVPKMVVSGPVHSTIPKAVEPIILSSPLNGAVHSVDAALGSPTETCGNLENYEGKLQPQNLSESLFGQGFATTFGDSPFSRDSRSRILDTLDKGLFRVQRSARISKGKIQDSSGVQNNASSLQGVGN